MKLSYILLGLLALCLAHCCVFGEEIDIHKVIMIESSGNPHAVSKSGCIGLMGINPKGALVDWNIERGKLLRKHNEGDLFNPSLNVRIGSWYLNTRIPQMLKAYGIEDTVKNRLIAYHDGIGNLRKYLKGERRLGKNMKSYLRKYKE